MLESEWVILEDLVRNIFIPQTPISKRELFVGRSNQIGKMLDAVRQSGSHAIIYGERGVGKTSLVSILPQLLSGDLFARIIISRVICDPADTYYTLFKKIFGNLTVTENLAVVKTTTQTALDLPVTLDMWLSDEPSPDEIRRLILTLKGRHLIAIIDEFDAISGKTEVTSLVSNTIKSLSDTQSPSTFILVGIADTVGDLIAQHASIDRCLSEILMPRMSPDEMRAFIKVGMGAAGLTIETDVVDYICRISQGLPSYVHLLCRESAVIAVRKHEKHIMKVHSAAGLQAALDQVPGILAQDWGTATTSPKHNNLRQVLLACALARKDDLGFFVAREVEAPYSAIMKKKYEIPGYARSLQLLTAPKRASILVKKGESHAWHYRFRNPLMEPYAIMYALSHNLINESIVTQFRRDTPTK